MKKIYKLLLFICLTVCLFTLTGCFGEINEQLNCEHNYVEVESTATCIDAGFTIYKCDKCGRQITVRVSEKGHDYEIIEDVVSTCTTKGHKTEKCKTCGDIKTTEYELAGHNYEETEKVDSTCAEVGHVTKTCTVCGYTQTSTIEKKDHTFSEWEVTTPLIDVNHDEETRECTVCHEKETRLVDSIYSMDTSILEYNYTGATTYQASNFEETSLIFNVAILNMQSKITIELSYDPGEFEPFFDQLCDSKKINFDYRVSGSLKSSFSKKNLELTFEYYNLPTTKTVDETPYEQYASLNAVNNTQTRSNDYDNFAINNATSSYNVTTTDQLVYVLERRFKPIPASGSAAETIYNKAKQVLREIINDDMTDYEKVKAIHDWLVLNVTYDEELLNLLSSNDSNIKSYNGFYLEGVFNDGFAVCDGISKALCVLANIEGIPCVRISGHETGVENGIGHAWNKIYIDKYWYIIDATSDGTIIDGTTEVLSYAYFLISDTKMNARYTGEDYTTYICSKDYDAFLEMKFTLLTNEYTMKINSQDELNKLIAYVKTNLSKNTTIQIEMAFDYGEDYDDELNKAYITNGISKGYAFIKNGSIVMLINE